MARRSFFGWRELLLLAVWGAITGGGVPVGVGWAIDALHGQFTGDFHSYTMAIFGAYVLFALLYVQYGRALTTSRGVSSWRSALNSSHGILLGHGITLLAVVMTGMHWTHFLACELVWLVVWWGRVHALLRFSEDPFVFDALCLGEWKVCEEVPMLLDLVASRWWKTFSMAQRKELWEALPDWKWTLHTAGNSTEVQRFMREWMELEDHPYWRVARGMHQDDFAESIRVFLAARDGGHGEESYEFAFD